MKKYSVKLFSEKGLKVNYHNKNISTGTYIEQFVKTGIFKIIVEKYAPLIVTHIPHIKMLKEWQAVVPMCHAN